jgi:hypothetical protein
MAIGVRVSHDPSQEQELRFLIATPSSAVPANKDAILSRVQRHASFSGGKYCAIIFHMYPSPPASKEDNDTTFPSPLHAFNDFQILLLHLCISVPLLPLNDPSTLASVITAFAEPFTSRKPLLAQMKPVNAALDVLPYCTTEARMREGTWVALTDQTTCLRDVAGLCGEDAQGLIEGGVSEEEVEAILGFWAEEWVME